MDEALYGLLLTVSLNSLLFLICLALFIGYRKLRSAPDLDRLTEGPPFQEAGSTPAAVLKKLYDISDTELGFYCRPEGFLYLSVIKHMAILLGIFAVLGASVLIPIYETGEEAHDEESTYEEYSVANVKGYNHEMVAPAISTIFIGCLVYYLGYRFFKNAYESELVYRTVDERKTRSVQMCTVQITGLPRGLPPRRLADLIIQEFEFKESDSVVDAKVIPDYTKLQALLEEKQELEKVLVRFKQIARESDSSTDAIIHYEQLIIQIEDQIHHEIPETERKNLGIGYVIFRNPYIASRQMKLFQAYPNILLQLQSWRLEEAPHPNDIMWEHLSSGHVFTFFRKFGGNILFAVTFMLLLTPVTMIGILGEILEDSTIDDATKALVIYYLPSLMFTFFQSFLIPNTITLLVRQEKHKLLSQAMISAIQKFLIYLTFNMILFPLVGAVTITIFIQTFYEEDIISWSIKISGNLIAVGEFYVRSVISMAFISNMFDLLVVSHFVSSRFFMWRAVTRQDAIEAVKAPVFDFGFEYSKVLIVWNLVLVFGISMPLILPFGFVYMFVKYWVDKYNLLFVYRVELDSGGRLQRPVLNFIMISVGLFFALNAGLFMVSGEKTYFYLGIALGFVAVLTLLGAALLGDFVWYQLEYQIKQRDIFNWTLTTDSLLEHSQGLYKHPCEKLIKKERSLFR